LEYKQKWLPKKEPWFPPDYDEQVIYAIRAISYGEATAYQQGLFWRYLMYVCGSSEEFADLSFRPGQEGERATTFAEGKRFVGLQLRKLLRPELTPEAKPETQQALTRRMIAQRLRRQKERQRNGQHESDE
jgi:hypothetical protein